MTRVGVVGLGAMGLPIARALADTTDDVRVFDASPVAADRARGAGLTAAAELEELAGWAEVVVLSLPSPAAVSSVVTRLCDAQTSSTILDTSTNDPDTARRMSDLAVSAGADYADCPVLGRPERLGQWTIPVGGSTAAHARAQAVLGPLARDVPHVGPVGSAAAIKVLNNLMLSGINAITAETLVLAEAVGLDPGVFVDVVTDSGAASVSGLFQDVAPRAVDGRFDPTFSLRLMHKDNALALQMASAVSVPLVLGAAAQTLNQMGMAAGHGDEDSIAVIKALELLTGRTARRGRPAMHRPSEPTSSD